MKSMSWQDENSKTYLPISCTRVGIYTVQDAWHRVVAKGVVKCGHKAEEIDALIEAVA